MVSVVFSFPVVPENLPGGFEGRFLATLRGLSPVPFSGPGAGAFMVELKEKAYHTDGAAGATEVWAEVVFDNPEDAAAYAQAALEAVPRVFEEDPFFASSGRPHMHDIRWFQDRGALLVDSSAGPAAAGAAPPPAEDSTLTVILGVALAALLLGLVGMVLYYFRIRTVKEKVHVEGPEGKVAPLSLFSDILPKSPLVSQPPKVAPLPASPASPLDLEAGNGELQRLSGGTGFFLGPAEAPTGPATPPPAEANVPVSPSVQRLLKGFEGEASAADMYKWQERWKELAAMSADKKDADVRAQMVQAGALPLVLKVLQEETWGVAEGAAFPAVAYACMQWAVLCVVHITRTLAFREHVGRTGVLDRLVWLLRRPHIARDHPELVKNCFLALINATTANKERLKANQRVLQAAGAPAAVARLLEPAGGPLPRGPDSCWAFGVRALHGMLTPDMPAGAFRAVASPGCLAALVEALEASYETAVQIGAIEIVTKVFGSPAVDHPSASSAVRGAGGVGALLDLCELHPSINHNVRKHAVGSLMTLTRADPACRDAVRQHGGIVRLLRLTADGVDNVCVYRALWTLNNMTAGNTANKDALRESGVIPRLLHILEHTRGRSTIKATLCALFHLTEAHSVNQEKVAGSGGIELLLRHTSEGDPANNEIARKALHALIEGHDAHKAAAIALPGGEDIVDKLDALFAAGRTDATALDSLVNSPSPTAKTSPTFASALSPALSSVFRSSSPPAMTPPSLKPQPPNSLAPALASPTAPAPAGAGSGGAPRAVARSLFPGAAAEGGSAGTSGAGGGAGEAAASVEEPGPAAAELEDDRDMPEERSPASEDARSGRDDTARDRLVSTTGSLAIDGRLARASGNRQR